MFRPTLILSLLAATSIRLLADPSPTPAKPMTEEGIDVLIARMTLKEKIGQLNFCRINIDGINQLVQSGEVGGFLNPRDQALRQKLEHVAVEQTRLGIPLLTGADVIHGYRTIFPIPLGQGAAWNPALSEESSRIAAREATAFGIRWVFAPMVDVARDPRWGRMAEGCGEDPYLTGVLGAAMVRGFQGSDPSRPESVAACPKHYAGYGASEGGRDYNTVDVSERTLRDTYLPPFKSCVDAGALTVMSAFSEVNGVPVSGSRFLLHTVLRDEWGFKGFVVSDAKAITQLVTHGMCADDKDAARAALMAGLDTEIISTCYHDHLEELVQGGIVPVGAVDQAVRNVLRVKMKLGLFEHPYSRTSPQDALMKDSDLVTARKLAQESLVLLKNDKQALPLSKDLPSLAVIGPLADAKKDQLGCWMVYGHPDDTRTPLAALRDMAGAKMHIHYAPGLADPTSTDHSGFDAAVQAARDSAAAVVFLGEPADYSGEAHNRAYLTLPGAQMDLLRAIHATGKPVIVVILAARPQELLDTPDLAQAIVMGWHPGTMGGPAIADVLFGDANFSGKLPVSWPRTIGQIPIHYNHQNTGRPAPDATKIAANVHQIDTSHVTGYVDSPISPLFPFGYGLSYTTYAYSNLQILPAVLKPDGVATVNVQVTNTGHRAGEEIAQLYIRDLVASSPQPVRELKGFQRVSLAPGETKTVTFTLPAASLAFTNPSMKRVIEPGHFNLWVGGDSTAELKQEFDVRD